jgi:hypothetical protein
MLNLKKAIIPQPKRIEATGKAVKIALCNTPEISITNFKTDNRLSEAKALIEKRLSELSPISDGVGDYKITLSVEPQNELFSDIDSPEAYFVKVENDKLFGLMRIRSKRGNDTGTFVAKKEKNNDGNYTYSFDGSAGYHFENRSTTINKDVQAYLKDVDFFFNDVEFNFDIQNVKPQINESCETFFKVEMVRTIVGNTITGDSINNSRNRFLEINLDSYKKELKIVSFYTTKPNAKEELYSWWKGMTPAWKNILLKIFSFITTWK